MDAQAQAPSPFLPSTKIQYAIDSTSLGLLKTCPRLYQYTMLDGWASPDESIHLRFGIEMHSALQEFEILRAQGAKREDALREVVHSLLSRTADWSPDEDTKAGKYKNRRSLVRAVIDYFDNYAADTAETFIKADGAPAVELSFRFELDWGPEAGRAKSFDEIDQYDELVRVDIPAQPYLLCGHLDRVVSFNDSLFVYDLKTTTSTPGSYYFDQYQPHNQMTLYSLAGRMVLGSPIKGVIIEAAQIAIDFTRFIRGITYRTEDQLGEWLDDLRIWLRLAEQYAEANYWPQNDTACDKFGGCKFREVCAKSPQVREKFLAAKFTKLDPKDRWNPLRNR